MISVIVPTFNNEDTIVQCLEALVTSSKRCQQLVEVIVTDNKSVDHTMDIVQREFPRICRLNSQPVDGLIVTCTKRGIGVNKNYGVKFSCGNILVFVHADDIVSESFLVEVEKLARDKSVIGGGTKYVLPNKLSLGILCFFLCIIPKCVLSHITLGAFWIRREFFRKLGGFSEDLSVMEDINFATRLKKYCRVFGYEYHSIKAVLWWSTRKFQQFGNWYWARHLWSFLRAVYTGECNREAMKLWYEDLVERRDVQ